MQESTLQPIRRQRHGIRAKSITVSLPGIEVDRVRGEAATERITPSARVAKLVKLGRMAEAMGLSSDDERTEAVTA